MKTAVLEVIEGKTQKAANAFLKSLLANKLLDALLVALELPGQGTVASALVSDLQKLHLAAPLAPVMPVSTARVVSQMTRNAPSQKRVGVVLRPCELRALVELVKLKQASLENLVLIGVDCPGTYSVAGYQELRRQTAAPAPDPGIREACQVCEYPAPSNADLVLGLMGMDAGKRILIQASSPAGEKLLEALKLPPAAEEELKKRETAISELVAERTKARDELFRRTQAEAGGLDNLLATLSACVNCHNCRVACPLCYCRECFLDSATFEWEAEKYLGWAGKKGALKMPTDTLLYHLTRLNHMVTSCVGCGLCQEACPNKVPVFPIFRLVGAQVQASLGYVPGRSLEEELPLSTFREDELHEVGE